jgi:hypothetical protein
VRSRAAASAPGMTPHVRRVTATSEQLAVLKSQAPTAQQQSAHVQRMCRLLTAPGVLASLLIDWLRVCAVYCIRTGSHTQHTLLRQVTGCCRAAKKLVSNPPDVCNLAPLNHCKQSYTAVYEPTPVAFNDQSSTAADGVSGRSACDELSQTAAQQLWKQCSRSCCHRCMGAL